MSVGCQSRMVGALSALLFAATGCDLSQPPPQAPPPSSAPSSSTGEVAPTLPLDQPIVAPSAAPTATTPPKSAALVEPGLVPSRGPTRGTLPKAAVAEGVERAHARFEACARKARNPSPQGTINVNFVIAPDGSVPYAAALESGTTIDDGALIDCVVSVFRRLRFAEPSGGRAVATYPLTFQPRGDAVGAKPAE